MNRCSVRAAAVLGATLMAIIALQVSCTNSNPAGDTSANGNEADKLALDENGRPAGWTEATHSKKATPDYALVFPQGEVRRIDITISPSDWQTMLDDMTNTHGAFGAGGQGATPGGDAIPDAPLDGNAAPGLPADMLAACDTCDGLQEGSACTCSTNGITVPGTCTRMEDGRLICSPQMDPGAGGGIPGGGGMPAGGGILNGDGTNPVVVPCTITFADKTWWYVGIRFKGNSSLMSTWSSGIYKLPLRLDFDAFQDEHPEIADQRFFGFEKLSLASNWSDPSCLREKVTHDIFRAAGVPAPHTGFYRVYLDVGQGPTYFGLYCLTEIPDNPMLVSQFGDDSGNLYKPTSNWVSFNQADFDKESNKDAADGSDVEAAIAALHADRTDAAAWRAGLEATFNVDGFLRWLAVNTVIVNWDTYGRMAHNYYLYGNPKEAGRLSWIPWDNNMALMEGMGIGMGIGGGMNLGGGDNGGGIGMGEGMAGVTGGLSLGLSEVNDQWPLIRFLMDDPVYKAAYISHMSTFVAGPFNVAAIQAQFQAEHDLIAPYVTGAEGEQPGYTLLNDPQEFDTALTDLLQFVDDRSAAATEFLNTQE